MKKYTNKKKTAITIAFMGILGLCAVMGMSQKEYKSTYASVEPSTQAVVYDDEQYQITFNDDETQYHFINLFNLIPDDIIASNLTIYFEFQQSQYTCNFDHDDSTANEYLYSDSNEGESISFFRNDVSYPGYTIYQAQFYSTSLDDFADILTIETSSTYYSAVKSAIELDIQANQPASQGDSIISAITSGLGLAPDVANEFVKGFTAVFWDSTNNSLTKVSNFMLVMLGIAIVMAIIKLSLSLIRSNTGA